MSKCDYEEGPDRNLYNTIYFGLDTNIFSILVSIYKDMIWL